MMEPAPAPEQETILVVDDEPSARTLVSRILAKEGYAVLLASDGQEAHRVCEQHPGLIQLLLADLLMPGMNGLELAMKVQASRPQTRVLFMSDSTLVASAFAVETQLAFLEKPFTADALINKVREVLHASR